MMKPILRSAAILAVVMPLLACLIEADAQSSADYEITRSVMSGGGRRSTSADYALTATIGQPSPVGDSLSADYNLRCGFWRPTMPVSETWILTMAISPAGGGTTTPPVGDHVYDHGTVVDIDATPDIGWAFHHWEGDVDGPPDNKENHVTMDSDKTVTAVFCLWLEPERTHSPEYIADSFFDVFVTIEYEGELTGLGLIENIPPMWSFVEVVSVDGTLLIEPPPGTTDTLEFLWDTLGEPVPPSPVHLTYRLQTVGVEEGHTVCFTGTVGYSWNAHTCQLPVPQTCAQEVVCTYHSSDYNPQDWHFNVLEIMRLIAMYKADPDHEYHCDPEGHDGYNPGLGPRECLPHSSDYRNGPDWHFDVMEIMRLIAMYKADPNHEYHRDPNGPDGYNPGPPPAGAIAVARAKAFLLAEPIFTCERTRVDYIAAGEVWVTLTLTYDMTPNALAVIEQIPAGCTFNRVEYVDGVLLLQPDPGTEKTLEFLWDTLTNDAPPSPVTLTYVLNVPGGDLGNEEITGVASIADDKGATVNAADTTPMKILEILEPTQGTVRVTWTSRPGATYTVWSCFDLMTGLWNNETTIPSGGETTTWTDADTAHPRKFYRIEIE